MRRFIDKLSKRHAANYLAAKQAVAALNSARSGREKRLREWEISGLVTSALMISPPLWTGWAFILIVLIFFNPWLTRDEMALAGPVIWTLGVTLNLAFLLFSIRRLIYYILIPLGITAFCFASISLYTFVAVASVATLRFLPFAPNIDDINYLSVTFFFAIAIAIMLSLCIVGFYLVQHPGFVDNQGPGKLLSQLPVHRRGELLAISAEDHYIRIYTNKGDTQLRMKFADVISTMAGTKGVQIHRSHWVASGAVERVISTKGGGKQVLLVNGITLPVARGRVASLAVL